MKQVLYIGWGDDHFRFEGDVDGYLKDHQPLGLEKDEFRGYAGTLQSMTGEAVPYYVRGMEPSSKEELQTWLESEIRLGESVFEVTFMTFHLFLSLDRGLCVVIPNSTYWSWELRGLLRNTEWKIEDEKSFLHKLRKVFPHLDWGYSVKEDLYRGIYERWMIEMKWVRGWQISLVLQPEKGPLVLAFSPEADIRKHFQMFRQMVKRLCDLGAAISPKVIPREWESISWHPNEPRESET